MDIPIKLKAGEKAALNHLNQIAPELYQEKNPGFRWVANMAAKRDDIDWERISKRRIEDRLSSGDFKDDEKNISHLTIDDKDFERLKSNMNKCFDVRKGVQKAFIVRSVIKWGMDELSQIARLSAYSNLMRVNKRTLSNADALKIFADLLLDETEIDPLKKRTKEELIALLTRYHNELLKRHS